MKIFSSETTEPIDLGWKSGPPDTIFKEGHPRTIHQSLVAIGHVVSEEKMFM
jgi:hypothetical protein